MVDREQLIRIVREQMPARRWEHTLGVMESAVELARRFGGDPVKADLAAILHDCAKYWPVDRQRQVIEDNGLPRELLDYDKSLWHAPAGAWFAEHELGVTDSEVLDAIRYHTSGRVGMTLLDKIVCLADYIERGRQFPGVERIRELAQQDLDRALVAGFDSTISHLLELGKPIFPLTILARNDLIMNMQGGNV